MNSNFQNLLAALQSLEVRKEQPVTYRLYHDDQGQPLFYSMEDKPGNYIEITKEQYHRSSSRVQVINGQLVDNTGDKFPSKLVPGELGASTHPQDVTIIVAETDPNRKWNLKICGK